MTAADLPFVVAAAPGTALLSAFLIGVLSVLTVVGLLGLFRRLASGHEQRCASCAMVAEETVPLPATVFAIAEASGVMPGE